MIDLGTIEHEELDLVNRLIHHCDPAEHQGNGVLLKVLNGKRVWQVGAQTTCMTITGGDAKKELDNAQKIAKKFSIERMAKLLEKELANK